MDVKNETFENNRSFPWKRVLIGGVCLILLAAAGVFGWWYWVVRDGESPTATLTALTTLAPELPEAEDFVLEIQDKTQVTVAYAREPDLTVAGEQEIALLLTDEWGNTAHLFTTLTVIIDEEPPVIEGVEDYTIYLGHDIDYVSAVSIRDEIDPAPVLTVDDSAVDLTREGVYEIRYKGLDASGNERVLTATLTIIEDSIAPTILGVNPISLYTGSTVAYRSGILVSDDQDESPTLTIDSSQVDLSQPGVYELTYTVTDDAGNATSITTTVTVKEKLASYVDEETIYAKADELLGRIVTEDMTDREKVEAIYRWMKNNLSYSNTSDKTDWLQAAYTMMTKRYGDCFNYYAAARLMFDRLGIPNITVRRSADSVRKGNHYWSLVSVDGGETWYHFDTTPRPTAYGGSRNFCLVTDAALDAYDRYAPGYYTRDLELYPATPEEELD